MDRWKAALLAGMIFYVLLFTAVEISAVCKPLYEKGYDKYEVEKLDFVKKYDVGQVTDEVIFYLADLSNNMNRKGLFEPREHRHMVDVKRLFSQGRLLRVIFLPFIFLLIQQTKKDRGFFRKFVIAYGVFLSLFGLIAVLGTLFFQKAFVKFHHLFFSNEDWLLSPKDSIIINLMPEGFFMDMAKYIAIIFFLLSFFNYFIMKIMYTDKRES